MPVRGEAFVTHGHTRGYKRSRTHRAWTNMKTRGTNPASGKASSYIDRGITICDRWLTFENFLDDMGECPPGLTLERRDNDKPYSPENCYWATKKVQANNRRTSRLLTYNGITQTVAQWADTLGIKASKLYGRLYRGWPIYRVLSEGGQPSCL